MNCDFTPVFLGKKLLVVMGIQDILTKTVKINIFWQLFSTWQNKEKLDFCCMLVLSCIQSIKAIKQPSVCWEKGSMGLGYVTTSGIQITTPLRLGIAASANAVFHYLWLFHGFCVPGAFSQHIVIGIKPAFCRFDFLCIFRTDYQRISNSVWRMEFIGKQILSNMNKKVVFVKILATKAEMVYDIKRDLRIYLSAV